MWKKRVKQAGLLLGILFICFNAFLLIYHEESIYKRKAYIESWSQIPRLDLRETVNDEGIYSPAEKTTLSLSPLQGDFSRLLVEEKDEVKEGDLLIEYQPLHFSATEQDLQTQLNQVTAAIAAVESTLAQLAEIQTSPAPLDDSSSDLEDEEIDLDDSSTYLQDQFRLETEEELAVLQAREAILQEQLEQLTETETMAVSSPIDGMIETIEDGENGPVITIASSELLIEGEVPEEIRKKLKKQMKVTINSLQAGGIISGLSDQPALVAEDKSFYGFQVSILDETAEERMEMQQILPGYHTVLEIILDEELNVPAVHENLLTDTLVPAVWVLEADGTLSYRELKTGMVEGRWTAIESGIEAGQPVAEPAESFSEGAVFVTPLHIRFIDWKQVNQQEEDFIKEYPLLAGLFHH